MEQQNLIVPINIQAYCVSGNDASKPSFIPAEADFSKLPYLDNGIKQNNGANLSINILSVPFDSVTVLERGVHLHWALPNALIQGAHNTSSKTLNFPLVPNRWLVTRVGFNSSNELVNNQSWVIESDFLSPTQGTMPSTIVPYHYGQYNTQPFQYMGRVTSLSSWTGEDSSNQYYENLTAIGYGNINFSSFYPNCKSVFGFYDNVTDITDALTLVYSVVGWYSDEQKDFLNTINQGESLNDWLAVRGWGVSQDAQEQLIPHTSASLYSGFVQNISWDPTQETYFDDSPFEASVVCANTGIETMSAFFATSKTSEALSLHTEDIFNAFQLGMMKELQDPNGLVKLHQALHAQRFNQRDGGPLWTIVPINPDLNSDPASATPAKTTIPQKWSIKLNSLNEVQLSLNNLRDSIKSLQWQIFSDWSKFMSLQYPTENPTLPSASDVAGYIKSELTPNAGALSHVKNSLEHLLIKEEELSREVKFLSDALQTEISIVDPKNPVLYKLICDKASSGRYYAPSNPSLLIAGKAQETWNYAGNRNKTSDGILECRISGQITVAPSELTISNSSLLYSDDINALVNEAIWIFENQDSLSPLTPPGPTETLLPEAIAMQNWDSTQWLPLLLQWQVKYLPLKRSHYPLYETTHITDNFEFEDSGSKLVFKGEPAFDTGIYGNYSGTIILTPSSKESLLYKLEAHPALQKYIQPLKDVPILSQTLDGFFEQMLMRQKTLQLDVFDPYNPADREFNDHVEYAVGNMNITAPLPENPYSPINDGVFQITKLQIVDTFGRTQAIDLTALNTVTYPKSATHETVEGQNYVQLSSGIIQDSRLSFDFLTSESQEEEMNKDPAISPICGWIFPNNLDESLMFYDPAGNPLGSLVAGSENIIWQSAPGIFKPGTTMQTCFKKVRNKTLYNMALATWKNGLAYLKDLIVSINQSLSYVEPSGYTGTISNAVLCGSPLALVQASIRLELQGLPSPDESYLALQADMNNLQVSLNALDRTDNNFTQVQFPVQLGDLTDFQDGLIGYFKGATPDVDYTIFYTTSDLDSSEPNIIRNSNNPLNLTPYSEYYTASDPTQYVSMLIDPRASINAISGILPVKNIKVSENQYAQALNSIYITFLTSPILTDSDNETRNVYIPTPKEGGAEWSWLKVSDNHWKHKKVVTTGETIFENPQQIIEGWLKLHKSSDGTS